MKITLSITELEEILAKAKENFANRRHGDDSEYIQIRATRGRRHHLESDKIEVEQLSNYAECNGAIIFKN